MFEEIAESFKRYLESLDFGEIQALNLDLAGNGGTTQPIENYLDSVKLLQAFDLFYYINSRLSYTAALLPIPDLDVPAFGDGQEISIKIMYEEFRGRLFHGIVSVLFIGTLNLFFARDLTYSKNALSELYYNLSLQVLSDEYELSRAYKAIGDLTADISSNIENGIRSNQLKREGEAASYKLTQKSVYEFIPKKSDFEKNRAGY